jgi:hypothetical protein
MQSLRRCGFPFVPPGGLGGALLGLLLLAPYCSDIAFCSGHLIFAFMDLASKGMAFLYFFISLFQEIVTGVVP